MKILISPDYYPGLPDEVYALAKKISGCTAKNIAQLRNWLAEKVMENFTPVNNTSTNLYKFGNRCAEVVDVDTSRPWTISDHGGSEYIQYLDHIVVDEKLNYVAINLE